MGEPMSDRLAILRDGRVESVVAAPTEGDPWTPPVGTTAVPCPNHVGPGWSYASGAWIVPPASARRIWTALEFEDRVEGIAPGAWDRLEDAKNASGLTPAQEAQIRAAVRQSQKAQEIVSDDPRTVAFLDAVVALGVITDAERARILFDP